MCTLTCHVLSGGPWTAPEFVGWDHPPPAIASIMACIKVREVVIIHAVTLIHDEALRRRVIALLEELSWRVHCAETLDELVAKVPGVWMAFIDASSSASDGSVDLSRFERQCPELPACIFCSPEDADALSAPSEPPDVISKIPVNSSDVAFIEHVAASLIWNARQF